MYKVMIVEDEMFVRLGFKNSTPWEKYGMTVCADVSNGKEAWDFYCGAERPDVVITDLRMPKMDGMELIGKIREADAQTRIVILSCLEDFGLVRQAMKLGVSNYILKLSMTAEEIEQVLAQVREELGAQQTLEATKGMIRNPDMLKENVIKDFVFYNLYSAEEFVRHIASLKLRLHPERLVVCMLEIDHFERMQEKFHDETGELIRATVLNMVNELLIQQQRGEVVPDKDRRYLFLFSFRDLLSEQRIHEELVAVLTKVQKAMERFFNISATAGVSGIRNDFAALRAQYSESLRAVEQKFFYGTGTILFQRELQADDLDGLIAASLQPMYERWSQLDEADRGKLRAMVQAFLDSGRVYRRQDWTALFARLMNGPAVASSLDETEMTILVCEYEEKLRKCETLDESVGLYGEFVDELLSYRGARKKLNKEIARVVQYVQQNYHTSISLHEIAERLQLSPNYLSTLFKRELELTFTEYLNRLRVEKAKELLLNTALKSYEIAEMVGFSDDSYFSRTFKKYVGERPNEFRRLWVKDWVG